MTTRQRIGQQIETARTKARLSQSQLAERVGTSQPAISAIEKGKRNVSGDLLDKIFAALGCEWEVVVKQDLITEKQK